MREWIPTGKKVRRIVVVGVLAGLLGFIGMKSAHVGAAGYYSETNAPEFYGLTKAIIQTGDTFAADDTRYRIFARDFEDGDMTGEIKIISNTVDTSQAGEYQIQYQVTDTDGNVSELIVPIIVQDDCENRYFERTLYSLPSVQNMSLAGTNRGNAHDRQMLGFYMEQGASIQVKIVSGADKLNLNYWNNDSSTELSQTITSEDTTIMSTVAGGVPFIQTAYDVEEPIVIGITTNYVNTITVDDNEITGKVTELPYYHYEDDEEEFFHEWEANTDSYAVIESEDLTVLVPYADRNYLINYYNKCHTSLDGFLSYWHKVVTEYDEFLGLSYDAEEPIDQNVKTKYFFKANVHGAGAAYYSGSHVGTNSSSVAPLFEMNWGGLHEVGHGYQGSLAHTGMELGEVSNNILGHYVQINKDIYTYNDDWLGSIINIEQSINNLRLGGTTFSELSLSEQLYFLVNVLDTYDAKETYAEINKLWRRAIRDNQSLTTQEAYVLAMHDLYDVNVAPYFEAWGLSISDSVKEMVSGSKNLYFLADIVNDSVQAESIRQDLSKEGIYSLVSAQELSEYQMMGDLNLSVVIDDVNNIIGKEVIIQNGEEYRKEITVTGNNVVIEDVPAGVYEIKLPVPKENIYEYTPILYAVVKGDTTNEVQIQYENSANFQPITDTTFRFNGLGDANFALITFTDNDTMNVISYDTAPHVYFTDEYAAINVYNLQNELVYSRSYIGNQSSGAANDEISIELGYKIEITHREAAARLVPYSAILEVTDSELVPTEKVTNYIVGEYGLYKETSEETSEDESYANYTIKLDEYIQKVMDGMSEEELQNKNIEPLLKKNLLVGILKLKEPEKTTYLQQYSYIYNGSSPVLSENEVTVMQYEEFNLYELLSATDTEDGRLVLSEDNALFSHIPDKTAEINDYLVPYKITDSDGNVTTGNVSLHLVENPKYVEVYYNTEYYQQQEDGSYLLKETVLNKAYVNTAVSAVIKEYEGYQHVNIESTLEQGVVTTEDTVVLKVYYNLIQQETSTDSSTGESDTTKTEETTEEITTTESEESTEETTTEEAEESTEETTTEEAEESTEEITTEEAEESTEETTTEVSEESTKETMVVANEDNTTDSVNDYAEKNTTDVSKVVYEKETTDKTEDTGSTETTKEKSQIVSTGDTNGIMLCTVLCCAMISMAISIVVMKKTHRG